MQHPVELRSSGLGNLISCERNRCQPVEMWPLGIETGQSSSGRADRFSPAPVQGGSMSDLKSVTGRGGLVPAEIGHSPVQNRPPKRTTPPGRIMPDGVALNPDSAIPRSLWVSTDRARVHVNREQVGSSRFTAPGNETGCQSRRGPAAAVKRSAWPV
jgi:hypothetical protein